MQIPNKNIRCSSSPSIFFHFPHMTDSDNVHFLLFQYSAALPSLRRARRLKRQVRYFALIFPSSAPTSTLPNRLFLLHDLAVHLRAHELAPDQSRVARRAEGVGYGGGAVQQHCTARGRYALAVPLPLPFVSGGPLWGSRSSFTSTTFISISITIFKMVMSTIFITTSTILITTTVDPHRRGPAQLDSAAQRALHANSYTSCALLSRHRHHVHSASTRNRHAVSSRRRPPRPVRPVLVLPAARQLQLQQLAADHAARLTTSRRSASSSCRCPACAGPLPRRSRVPRRGK